MLLSRQAAHEIHMPADVVIEDRQIAAGHVGDGDVVPVDHQLVKDATHRDDIVVRVRREAGDPFAARQLGATPYLGAKRVEHLPVQCAGRAVSCDEGRQVIMDDVARFMARPGSDSGLMSELPLLTVASP